jgi:hypothetical protein
MLIILINKSLFVKHIPIITIIMLEYSAKLQHISYKKNFSTLFFIKMWRKNSN